MRIGEIATTHPIEVLPHTPVFEAARSMADLRVGDVIVTDPSTGRVVGMLTDRDIAVRVVARNLDAATTPVGDVSTHEAATVAASADISALPQLMSRYRVWRLPVVDDDGALVGVVSISDLASCGEIRDGVLRDLVGSLRAMPRDNRNIR